MKYFAVTLLVLVCRCFVGIYAINTSENEIAHPDAKSHPNPKLPASEMPRKLI